MTTPANQPTRTANKRWIGEFPKIGIRPAIDGRRRG